ncbi:MAG: SPOR domain-containing protein [Desulfuromonadales bacterium]|nr:SPOR domain-containing protein [Desulfuromonadales bacterium]MBN2792292.1 SPOR domain-containing protein [Desulfuromonadales bacterium]
MKGTAKTRTQRRMEKRQAIILLVLVLVVSLASFTLGVIVGRRGAQRDFAHKLKQTEKVLVAPSPAAAPVPVPKPETAPANESKQADSAPPEEQTKLSFYDNLAKETAPLGTGINLAPEEEKPAPQAIIPPPIELPAEPVVQKSVRPKAEPAVDTTPISQRVASMSMEKSSLPPVTARGSHAVQVGSFNAAGDAMSLKQKMLAKGYPAFVVEADLGEKGLWYRVRIGPYVDAVTAKQALKVLEEKEQMKGFVSRRN